MEVLREGNKVVIEMSSPELAEKLQSTLDYARYLELTANIVPVTQEVADGFADDLKRDWWIENKHRFIK